MSASNMLPPHEGTKRRSFHSYQPPVTGKPLTSLSRRPRGACVCQVASGGNVRHILYQWSRGTSPLPIAIKLPSRASV